MGAQRDSNAGSTRRPEAKSKAVAPRRAAEGKVDSEGVYRYRATVTALKARERAVSQSRRNPKG